MNSHIQKLLLVLSVSLLGIGLGTAYAQTDTVPTQYGYVITFGTFVASGVFYSASGWIKQMRRHLAGQDVKLDYSKMGKSVLIGLVLGVGAFVWSSYQGEAISVNTTHEFLTQVAINTSAILLIDKWLLGRTDDTQQVAPNPLHDFDDVDTTETVPPGKAD